MARCELYRVFEVGVWEREPPRALVWALQALPHRVEGAPVVGLYSLVPPLPHQSLKAGPAAFVALVPSKRPRPLRLVSVQALPEIEFVM